MSTQHTPRMSERLQVPIWGHSHALVYGVKICSNARMPELPVWDGSEVDAAYEIRRAEPQPETAEPEFEVITRRETNTGFDLEVRQTEHSFELAWLGAAKFTIDRQGQQVVCNVENPTITANWINSLFYGVILSYLLHIRGNFNLHAGGIVTGRGGIGLLAEAGTGKSTLTAHLVKNGFKFLTDDIVAPSKADNGYVIPPGFPYVSLTAESIQSVFGPDAVPDGMERGNVDVKERIHVDGEWASFASDPEPLHGLVVLSRGEGDYSFNRLEKQEAVMAMVQHSVALPLLPRELVSKHMSAAADLVAEVPVWRLQVPAGLNHIPQTIDVIRQNFA